MQDIIKKFFENLDEEIAYKKEFSRIAKIHKYWSRKPWYIVEKYIKQYSQKGDIVLDPFCGSSSTGLEAVLNERKFIGTDLNPMSILVSEGTLQTDFNKKEFINEFKKIEIICKDTINHLYKTDFKCDLCNCFKVIKYVGIGPAFNDELPCHIYCPQCQTKKSSNSLIISRNTYKNMYPDNKELDSLLKWVPEVKFPTEFYKDRFSYKGISKVTDMYTKRNLVALSLILNTIKNLNSKYETLLTLAFTNTSLHSSKLKGINVRPLGVNNYWIPDDYIEENVWFRFENRIEDIVKAKTTYLNRFEYNETSTENVEYDISLKSALHLELEQNVDYIFTDPPYGEAIQYSELSYMWNAWINKEYVNDEEVIINPKQNKGNTEFQNLLDLSLKKMYSLLKPNGYFTLCFQNKDSKVWADVIKTCKNLNLSLYDIQIYDTFGHPYNKGWAKFSPKADIYVTFKKSPADNSLFYSEVVTVDLLIKNILDYMYQNKKAIDIIKVYDATIALLIWNYFYNDKVDFNENFTPKSFQKIIDTFLEEKKFEEQIDKTNNQLSFFI